MEVLLVVGLFSMTGALLLYADIGSYRGGVFRAEKTTVVTLLQKARNDALNNIDHLPHGVAFSPPQYPDSYVLFEGERYEASGDNSRVAYPQSRGTRIGEGSPREVVFEPLTGNASYSGDILLLDTARGITDTISINSEGLIDW